MNISGNVIDSQWKATLEKIRARGIAPMSPEEKAQFIKDEGKRTAISWEQYCREHPVDLHAVAAHIGLREDELALDWSKVKPGYSDGMNALEAVRPAFERGHGLIFLCGTYGQAKTLVGKILIARAHALGKKACYASFLEALNNIRQAFDEPEGKTTELIRRLDWWTSRDVLFLDEFDKCNDTAWAQEQKFLIVDRCYQRALREQALTVIASNRSDEEIDGYIRSRLQDSRLGPIVYLNGPDGRKVMPAGWTH